MGVPQLQFRFCGNSHYYEIPTSASSFTRALSVTQGSYRALAATANHFARESHMDELAHAVKMDPLEFRMKNLKNERLRAVFEAAAGKFGWGKRRAAPGEGFEWAAATKSWEYSPSPRSMWIAKSARESCSHRFCFRVRGHCDPATCAIRSKDRTFRGWVEPFSKPSSLRTAKSSTAGCRNIAFRDSATFPRSRPFCSTARTSSVGAGECPMIGLAQDRECHLSRDGVRLRSLRGSRGLKIT